MAGAGRRATAVAAALAVLLAGCGTSDKRADPVAATDVTWSGSPGDRPDTWSENVDPDSRYGLHRRRGLETVLRPETTVLSAAESAAITHVTVLNAQSCLSDVDDHPMCEFSIGFTDLPDGITVGTVINSGITDTTPQGLLVRVTSIDGTTVLATQATLQDAVTQGELWAEHTFTADEVSGDARLADGVTLVPPTPTAGGRGSSVATAPGFDGVSLPGSLTLDIEPADGVHVTGSLDFGAGCGLSAGVGGSDVGWVEVSCQAWEETGLEVRSTVTGKRSAERYFVADIPFAAFPVPLGPVVVVVIVDVLVTVDLDGNVHAGLHYGATETTEVYGGLSYSISGGLDHTGGVSVHGLRSRHRRHREDLHHGPRPGRAAALGLRRPRLRGRRRRQRDPLR